MAPNSEYVLLAVSEYLATALADRPGVHVEVEQALPWQERYAALDAGTLHVAWICGGPYVRRKATGAPDTLLAAPVWRAPRYMDRAVYFSDLIVRADLDASTFADLRGAHLAVNEPGSYSGYDALRAELAERGEERGYFGRVTIAGSHQSAIELVLAGGADTASIDSTVLEEEVRRRPELAEQLRIVHTIGPAPMPPWVASPALDAGLRTHLRSLLIEMHTTPEGRRLLAQTPVTRFAAVTDDDYDAVRSRLEMADRVHLGP
jgi:phosphonate transport system substrate-binding protein